jgi:hypothetical protein
MIVMTTLWMMVTTTTTTTTTMQDCGKDYPRRIALLVVVVMVSCLGKQHWFQPPV